MLHATKLSSQQRQVLECNGCNSLASTANQLIATSPVTKKHSAEQPIETGAL